jgi:DeoD family purine-nucleoside phosphorylase
VSTPVHLHPTASLAERVLLPGDPGRALLLATALLREPKMFNHNRGLWGYSGQALLDEQPLTIQSTGMGGPSAAIVISELVALGAETFVRVGTCGGLDPALELGQLLAVTGALPADGASRALGADGVLDADPDLRAALEQAAGDQARSAIVVSTDLFYDTAPGTEERWAAEGVAAVEMEAATLFALARRHGVRAAALLAVSDLIVPERRRISEDALREAEHRLGEAAIAALAALAA